jgi:hypothetical protein
MVAAGGNTSYVVLDDGSVLGFGGATDSRIINVPVDLSNGHKKVASVAVGWVHYHYVSGQFVVVQAFPIAKKGIIISLLDSICFFSLQSAPHALDSWCLTA